MGRGIPLWRFVVALTCVVSAFWLVLALGFAFYSGTSFGQKFRQVPTCSERMWPGDPECYGERPPRPLITVAGAEAAVSLVTGSFLAAVAAWYARRRRWLAIAIPSAWFLGWGALFLSG